jgi:DNA-binding LytR/AlgR family response regulator
MRGDCHRFDSLGGVAAVSLPTAIICEDEAPQRTALVQLLAAEWPELRIVAECEDGLASLEALKLHGPAVAFLDIRMPGVSGLLVAAQATPATQVVFTTAYADHAVQAFEQGAVDYLLKPIDRERLRAALARVRQRLADREPGDVSAAAALLREQDRSRAARALHWIAANVGTTTRMLPLAEILFFQASDKYTRVVTSTGEAIIRTSLKELVSALDADDFWQVHRSVIVRVAGVRAMHHLGGEKYELELAGSLDRVPVSVAFKDRFRGM